MPPRPADLPSETLGIRHIALKVKDLAAAERFYVDILGFAVEWRPDPDNVYLAKDKDSLALHKADFSGEGSLDHFGIMLRKAQDVDAWANYLKKHGFNLEKEPRTHRDGARSFYTRDPEGNLIQFIHHPLIHY
ncbi:MAG TPA: VOC family protein [Elusimicrobiota bacterium]|nr:VOC family protein [Elusimicrobiota bacterium]